MSMPSRALGKRPRIDSPTAPDTPITQRRSLSALESLPVELLQMIFVLCRSLSLPQSSPHIGSALASDRLKEDLVLYAFSSNIEKPGFSDSQTELQSALLCQKWLSYSFFQRCQKRYMFWRAIQLLIHDQYFSNVPMGTRTAAAVQITFFFDDYYVPGLRLRRHVENWYEKCNTESLLREYRWTGIDKAPFSIRLLEDGSHMELNFTLASRVTHIFWPCILRSSIPDRLLHGPWTNDRGHFLSLLLEQHMSRITRENFNIEVAERGLKDAIREGNIRAIERLVNRRGTINPSIDSQLQVHFGRRLGRHWPGLVKPEDPWIFGHTYDGHLKTLDILVTAEHLKIAILEQGCDLAVVDALTSGVDDSMIDYEDRDLLKWATEQIDQAKPAETRNVRNAFLMDETRTAKMVVLAAIETMRRPLP